MNYEKIKKQHFKSQTCEGKKYYGQWNPPTDFVIHNRYFPDKIGGVCIECGAFDGLIENNSLFFEENLGWKCINVEPLPYIFEELQKNRPMAVNFNFALSNTCGSQTFRQYELHGFGKVNNNGSLSHSKKDLELKNNSPFFEFPVQTIDYPTLIKMSNIQSIDFFVLDVEGHELQVIESMRGCTILPYLFVIEFPHITLERLQTSLELNLPKKYKLDFIHENNAFFVRQKD